MPERAREIKVVVKCNVGSSKIRELFLIMILYKKEERGIRDLRWMVTVKKYY